MKKILIIEDEKMLAEMYEQRFIQAGFKVVMAYSAEEGIKTAAKEKPDLILLDILLPRENGIGFLGKLRKNPETAPTKVVAFSNYDEPVAKKEALEFGVKEYLIKTDYTPQEIVEKVKKYIK